MFKNFFFFYLKMKMYMDLVSWFMKHVNTKCGISHVK